MKYLPVKVENKEVYNLVYSKRGLLLFFIVVSTCIKFTVWNILSIEFSSIKHIHTTVQNICLAFPSCKTETLYLLNSNFPSPTPPALENHPFSLSMILTTLDTSYECNHTSFVLLWLSY